MGESTENVGLARTSLVKGARNDDTLLKHSITATGALMLSSLDTISIRVDEAVGITLVDGGIILRCGGNGISVTEAGISLRSGGTVVELTPAGIRQTAPSVSDLEA